MDSYPSPGDALPRKVRWILDELKRLAVRFSALAKKVAALEAAGGGSGGLPAPFHVFVDDDLTGGRINFGDAADAGDSVQVYWVDNGMGFKFWRLTAPDTGNGGVELYLDSDGFFEVRRGSDSIVRADPDGGGGTLLRFFSAPGVDGTDAPTTASQLADVIQQAGLIASHTVP